MPNKNRTYEVNSPASPALRLQVRPTKDEEEILRARPLPDLEKNLHSRKGQRYSRDLILRLIDWFKES